MASPLPVRHIQDHGQPNATLEHHWGYPDRVLPCTKDSGTCEYLDAVYWMHDISMLYTYILWAVLLGIAVIWVIARGRRMGRPGQCLGSVFDKLLNGGVYAKRRWLLQDAPARWLLGRVTRLQAVVLAVMLGYLLLFSLVSIVYRTWITPINGSSLHNTRTGLGGFSDRIGALAFALTPFTILLSNRESVLSLLTGIPYQHFNFLHRWLGRIIFIQAFLHTLSWTIIEGRLYQPQPAEYARLMAEQHIVFGVVAMFLLTLMLALSTQTAIRWVGYEVFKITHWVIAVLFIGACWGDWDRLWCWMVPSLALMVIDQGIRVLRMMYIHLHGEIGGGLGFRRVQAGTTLIGTADDLVVRLDFNYKHRRPWQAGQHFYICFPSLSIWQSHPFTPASLPDPNCELQHHTYLLRVRAGQTAQLAALGRGATVPAILTGPYGRGLPSYEAQNVLAVAGGTGVTFTLPIMLAALKEQMAPKFALEFVCVVRKTQDLLWLEDELGLLKSSASEKWNLRIKIFITRESEGILESGSAKDVVKAPGSEDMRLQSLLAEQARFDVAFLEDHHPSMFEIMDDFLERARSVGGSTEVLGSGPEAMGSDLRSAVAKVKGTESLSFYWDSRE